MNESPSTDFLSTQGALMLSIIGVKIMEGRFDRTFFSTSSLINYFFQNPIPVDDFQLVFMPFRTSPAEILSFFVDNVVDEMIQEQFKKLPVKNKFEVQCFTKNPEPFEKFGAPFLRLVAFSDRLKPPDLVDLAFDYHSLSWYGRKNMAKFEHICRYNEIYSVSRNGKNKKNEINPLLIEKIIIILEKSREKIRYY